MDDLISRQDAIYAIEKRMDDITCEDFAEGMSESITEISLLPSAQPKTGRWIIGNKTSVFDLAGVETWAVKMTCSECSFSLNFVEGHTAQYRFCPNCGAKME